MRRFAVGRGFVARRRGLGMKALRLFSGTG